MSQQIRFCTSSDGLRLAYAVYGQGPPLVKAAHWLTHLEHDWNSPVWRHWHEMLGRRHTVVRYDERGCGLSDREPSEISPQAWLADLEAVVDAAGVERFVLLGMSQGGPIAIEYAARHPDRVSHLVLYGTYARGKLHRPQAEDEAAALVTLTRMSKQQPTSAYRRMFTSLFIPSGTPEQMGWFDELQLLCSSADYAAESRRVRYRQDVRQLATQVKAPTLVMHSRDDALVPFEEGRLVATLIPGAELLPLDSANHVLLADEPAFAAFDTALHQFVGPGASRPSLDEILEPLTVRELEVLELIASGLTNDEIADKLFVSARTVERHLSNLYRKLGLSGKAARAAAAAWFSRRQHGR
jgi:pimeloyl-ACP methyl ester carboxylesterase/DNA-binding CsgD family transcriptional regulator